jgi:sterol desaturase/sphingolipid hydroxylase (fatty acid hydroxylase superfamily)
MDGLIGQSEGLLRLGIFLGVFLVLALVELAWPKRKLAVSKGRRWLTNLGIAGVDSVVLRAMAALAVPIAAVAAAFYAQVHGLGLLNQVGWPQWLKVVVALLVLDLAIWAQHLASHKIAILWRLHQVHHADRDIDVTTAVRFHPVEIALSMLWKIVVVVPLGASPFAVFLFEVILNACAMFNHANIALPGWLDRIVRMLVVTPDMHRVHPPSPKPVSSACASDLTPIRARRRRASAGACGCRSGARSQEPKTSSQRPRSNSWENSAGTALRSARNRAPAPARN